VDPLWLSVGEGRACSVAKPSTAEPGGGLTCWTHCSQHPTKMTDEKSTCMACTYASDHINQYCESTRGRKDLAPSEFKTECEKQMVAQNLELKGELDNLGCINQTTACCPVDWKTPNGADYKVGRFHGARCQAAGLPNPFGGSNAELFNVPKLYQRSTSELQMNCKTCSLAELKGKAGATLCMEESRSVITQTFIEKFNHKLKKWVDPLYSTCTPRCYMNPSHPACTTRNTAHMLSRMQLDAKVERIEEELSSSSLSSVSGGVWNKIRKTMGRCNAPKLNVKNKEFFVQIPPENAQHRYVQVAVGSSRVCGLSTDGRLNCWGVSRVPEMSIECKKKLATSQNLQRALSAPPVHPRIWTAQETVQIGGIEKVKRVYRNAQGNGTATEAAAAICPSSDPNCMAMKIVGQFPDTWMINGKTDPNRGLTCPENEQILDNFRNCPSGKCVQSMARQAELDLKATAWETQQMEQLASDVVCESTRSQRCMQINNVPATLNAKNCTSCIAQWGHGNPNHCRHCAGLYKSETLICDSCVKVQPNFDNFVENGPTSSVGKMQGEWGRQLCHKSCKTCVAGDTRPTACTSCPGGTKTLGKDSDTPWADCPAGLPCHHTILDPKRNAGTCHVKPCAYCKPRSCCGPDHKHFVADPDSMAGVCVRHTDDCTPHCATSAQTGRSVCSKGCNNIVRLMASSGKHGRDLGAALGAGSGAGIIAVCQAEKVVDCPTGNQCQDKCDKHMEADIALFHNLPGQVIRRCKMQKKIECKAMCSSLSANEVAKLHNLGSTCITNVLQHPQCFKRLSESVSQMSRHGDREYQHGASVAPTKCADILSRCGTVNHGVLQQAAGIVGQRCSLDKCDAAVCESLALTY